MTIKLLNLLSFLSILGILSLFFIGFYVGDYNNDWHMQNQILGGVGWFGAVIIPIFVIELIIASILIKFLHLHFNLFFSVFNANFITLPIAFFIGELININHQGHWPNRDELIIMSFIGQFIIVLLESYVIYKTKETVFTFKKSILLSLIINTFSMWLNPYGLFALGQTLISFANILDLVF